MSSIFLLLQRVHDPVHVFTMKKNYSEPKIYTGGIAITNWTKLSTQEKKKALSKTWYLYFSYRSPKTGKLKRQTNIKGDANKFTSKKDRYGYLLTLQKALTQLLEFGFNPYQDNRELEQKLFEDKEEQKVLEPRIQKVKIFEEKTIKTNEKTIAKAFKEGMLLRANMMSEDSFKRYISRINLFVKWLKKEEIFSKNISSISKNTVTLYLNEVLLNSSPRNRNNTRTDIASLFQLFQDNEIITENFVKSIPKIATKPKRNKTYKPEELKNIFDYVAKEDQHLMLFIKFIAYGFLRPIEVCRLKIEDVDLINKKLQVKAKNKPSKIKIIPEILLNQLPDTKGKNPKSYYFGKYAVGVDWKATPTNKRNEFTARFKKIKNHFGLSENYGLYSFRHTYITKLYRKLRETKTTYEAKSHLMMITGHETMDALNKYLRDIDAELPEDFSKLFD